MLDKIKILLKNFFRNLNPKYTGLFDRIKKSHVSNILIGKKINKQADENENSKKWFDKLVFSFTFADGQ